VRPAAEIAPSEASDREPEPAAAARPGVAVPDDPVAAASDRRVSDEPAEAPADPPLPVDATEPSKLPTRADARSLRRALARRQRAVRACALQHGVLPGMGVKVEVELDFAADGTVTASRPLAQFANADLGRCVARAAGGAKLPKAKNGQTVRHTFTL
jgi:hypothetical protein